jgi:two-component system sensor histidine kinase BaeS
VTGSRLRELWRSRFARRLTVAFAATAVAAAALTALLVNLAIAARFDAYLESQRQARAQQIVDVLAAEHRQAGGWRPQSLNRLGPAFVMSGTEVDLLGADGRPVWSTAGLGMSPGMAAMHREMMGTPQPGTSVRWPVTVDGRQVGTALLRVPQAALPAADEEFRTSVNRLLLGGALVAGLLALLVGLVLARRPAAGVTELTAAANELAAGRRDRRAAVSSADEIGDLATAFNAMADTVVREDELRRLFAADVAHELRTPLTILRSQLEAVQDGLTAPTSEVVDSLHEESLRLGRLVADLETLAAADAAAFSLDRSETALRPLVREVLDGFTGHLAERELTLDTDLAEMTAHVDPARVRQVLTNLLSNAAKFTPRGGRVSVTLAERAGVVELAVADTGAGIPADEQPRVFERFFRGAGSRAAGSGIGLAVAAELVAAHGGEITVRSEPGHGSRFLVRLPGGGSPSSTTFIGSSQEVPSVDDVRTNTSEEWQIMQYRTRRLGLAVATAVALGTGLTGAGVAVAQPAAPDTDEQMQQMDRAMEQCTEAMPAEMRDDARQMHQQMRPTMRQMISREMSGMGGSGMGGMMGGSGMGGMMGGSGTHGGDGDSGDSN